MRPLIDRMQQKDPQARPTAMQCIEQFQDVRSRLNRWALLSPTSNMLHAYGYANARHKVKDEVYHRYEYLRLLVKAILTKKWRS